MIDIIMDNWEIIASAIVAVLAMFKGAEWFKYLLLVKRLALVAYAEAEAIGVDQEVKGFKKLAPFMEFFAYHYQQRFGELPGPAAQALATRYAANEARVHKLVDEVGKG